MQEHTLDARPRESPQESTSAGGSSRTDGPLRTCIGCRKRVRAAELLRVVADREHHVVQPDPRHRMPGRGAHLHPVLNCFDQAVRRRAFARALRCENALDSLPLEHYLQRLGKASQGSTTAR